MPSFDEALARVAAPDATAAERAGAYQERLTKPSGSLGLLEKVGIQLSAIAGSCPPPVPAPATVAVFVGDHGVLEEGVSPWPQEVTAQMVANFCGGGAAVNVLARHVGADVVVVDVATAADLPPAPTLRRAKIRRGSGNIAAGPAMSDAEVRQALDLGAGIAMELADAGARCLLTGDMGIGNTTPAAALVAAFTGSPAAEVTGRGTGVDDTQLKHKVDVVERALSRVDPRTMTDPVDVLASLGGLEIAALTGFLVGGAAARLPVLLDGLIADAAALVAVAIAPEAVGYFFAGHRSVEPGATVALAHLGLDPLVDLELRLGEGTGACLALPILQAAAKILGEMATFESAQVSERGAAARLPKGS